MKWNEKNELSKLLHILLWNIGELWVWNEYELWDKTIEVFSLIYKFWDTDCISFVWFYIRFIIYYACVCVCVFLDQRQSF